MDDLENKHRTYKARVRIRTGYTGRQPLQNGQCFFFPVSGVWPFCEGWRPVFYGTPTLTEWPVPFFVSCFWCCAILEGWRPVFYGTPTVTQWPVPFIFLILWHPVFYGTPALTEWPAPFFPLFQASCRSVRVGVPFFAGREPSQNGQCPFFFLSAHV